MKMSNKLNILKNKVYRKLVNFFFKCIRRLNDKMEQNPHNLSIGDVYWCEMPLPLFELYRVPSGHRVRPYVVLDIKEKSIVAYACSSQTKNAYNRDYYWIDRTKYPASKDSFVDTTRTWEIPYTKLIQYFYTLDDDDLNDLLSERNKGHFKYLKREIGMGSIVKDENDKLYYIDEVEKEYLKSYKMFFVDDDKRENGCQLFVYDSKKYYIKTNEPIELAIDSDLRRIAQLSMVEMYKTRKEIEKMKKNHKVVKYNKDDSLSQNTTLLMNANIAYPIGTVFYHVGTDQYFVYLFSRKNKCYGVLEEDWSNDKSQLKRINLDYVSKIGILEQDDFNSLIHSLEKRFKYESVIEYLCKNYVKPDIKDALYRS